MMARRKRASAQQPATTGGRAYLLDISYFIFRAYHALPEMRTSAGLPTNAVRGVASMLEAIIREDSPEYLVAVFDPVGGSFRDQVFPDYKANRGEPDEDIKVQFPLVERLVDAMAIPRAVAKGYEADDVIATLARRFAEAGHEVTIVSGDKDLMQCVDERVVMFDPMRKKHFGPAEVEERFGVGPQAVADVLGIMGDSSDNLPGVRGVGAKGASALMAHFGSVEAMLERSAEIEELDVRGAKSLRRKIEEGREDAVKFKDLATVRNEVALDLELEDLRLGRPEESDLVAFFEELEMKTLATRVGRPAAEAVRDDEVPPQGAEEAKPKKKRARKKDAALGAFAGKTVHLALGRDEFDRALLALKAGKDQALFVDEEVGPAIAALGASGASLCGSGIKDLCREYLVEPGPEGFDLGLASYLVDASGGGHDADDLARRFLGENPPAGDTEEQTVWRAEAAGRLADVLGPELAARGQDALYSGMELPLLSVLADIERRGILLDGAMLERLGRDFARRMGRLVKRIYKEAGEEFNVLSPQQLRVILFDKLELPTKGLKRTKTGVSTDSDSLEALREEHALPGLILEYRGLAKLKSTYLDQLPAMVDEDSRIHTRLNQTATATGRLSSSAPNLQNIPIRTEDGARIREAFIAPKGKVLVSADYNQIELRVLAHLSGDKALAEAFAGDVDVHRATAAELFDIDVADVSDPQRREAKLVNYGLIYGMGPVRLSRELGIDRSQATAYIERYFERYSEVRSFYDRMLEQARELGYVSTIDGRRRYLPDIHSDHGGRRQAAERVATNTPIQGSAADIIKIAMVRLAGRLKDEGLEAAMVLQVHDELLLECPKRELKQVVSLVEELMAGAASLSVPLLVDVGHGANWALAH